MFYPEKMSKVTIAAPKSHIEEIINVLYGLNALHIKDYREKEFSAGSPLPKAEKISEILLDINSVKSVAGIAGSRNPADVSLAEAEKTVKALRKKAALVYEKRKEIEQKTSGLEKKEKALAFLGEAGVKKFEQLGGYKTLEMASGFLKKPLQDKNIIVISRNEKGSPAILFYSKDDKEARDAARRSIAEEKIEIEGSGGIGLAIKAAADERNGLERQKRETEKAVAEIRKESSTVLAIEAKLLEEIKKSEAPLKFGASSNAFIVEGWVPSKNAHKVKERVGALTKSAYIKIEEAEDGPTKMNNPKGIRPFEFFLNLYSLPRYDELDPTWLIFLSFPLFYGFMLGDIGYGLVILLLSLALRPRLKKLRAVIDISILSAISTTFFGYVFGEFFGAEEILGYHLQPMIHRIEQINEMIIASALLGFVHINAGFILGFINERSHHGFAHAVMAKLSWMILEAGVIGAALIAMGYLNLTIYVPAAVMLIAIAMITKSEGIAGFFELPSLLTNVLSYARLAAIGLASASLALVVNKMAGPLFQAGFPLAIMGVVILVIGHSLNMAIGIMDAFLQSMRLHYVELFSKFYKGAGKPYRPFGQDNK